MPGGDVSWKPPSSIRNRETAGGLFAASPRRKIILKDTGDRTPYAYPTVGSRTRRSYEGGQAGLVSQPATQVDNALASEQAGISSDVVLRKRRTCTTCSLSDGSPRFSGIVVKMTNPSESEIMPTTILVDVQLQRTDAEERN